MTPPLKNSFQVFNQRGIWLRYFLERVFLLITAFGLAFAVAGAQITVEKPLHLSRVQGLVTDRFGKPISDADVTLDRGELVIFKAKKDSAGRFALKEARGKYWLHVKALNHATAGRDVTIDSSEFMSASRYTVYVMLGPGPCMDECSEVFGSKKEFEKAVRWNSQNKH